MKKKETMRMKRSEKWEEKLKGKKQKDKEEMNEMKGKKRSEKEEEGKEDKR